MEKLELENEHEIAVPLFGAANLVQHLLHRIKAQEFYTDLDLYQQY